MHFGRYLCDYFTSKKAYLSRYICADICTWQIQISDFGPKKHADICAQVPGYGRYILVGGLSNHDQKVQLQPGRLLVMATGPGNTSNCRLIQQSNWSVARLLLRNDLLQLVMVW